MTSEGHHDEFGLVGPAPVEHPARRIPDPDFPTSPAVGDSTPEFQRPNRHGELVDFHATPAGTKPCPVFNARLCGDSSA